MGTTLLCFVYGMDLFAAVISGEYVLDAYVPTAKLVLQTIEIVAADPGTALKVILNVTMNSFQHAVNIIYNYYCPSIEALKDRHFVVPSQYADVWGTLHEYPSDTYEENGYYHRDAVIKREIHNLQVERILTALMVFHVVCCICYGLSAEGGAS